MRRSLFDTPILSPILRIICIGIGRLFGWRAVGSVPREIKSYVMVMAPHTSNWDFALFTLGVLALRLNVYVIAKKSLFVGPIGWFLTYARVIPIDRGAPAQTIRRVTELFSDTNDFSLIITPEGTRSATRNWKTGFYKIAESAQVPIIVGFINANKKEFGVSHVMYPNGDMAGQMAELKAFYDTQCGVRPENYLS